MNSFFFKYSMAEEPNENQFIEMAKHFKEVVENKENEILDLKKKIILIYGLIRASDENWEDINFVELIRQYCSTWVESFI